jgi:undecaprenyl diphosphate synthase
MQSEREPPRKLHVGIIMDGNGRWGTRRGLSRSEGHRAGAVTVRDIVGAAHGLGITTLTLFALSSDNMRRPADEVTAMMGLVTEYLRAELSTLLTYGVRLSVIGRRDRLLPALRREIRHAERASAGGRTLHVRIALDYSSRSAIAAAAARWQRPEAPSREAFARLIAGTAHANAGCEEVDLLIRTSGEKRLSDFLLWESAYAELWFTDTLWPDFTAAELGRAIAEFHGRERRFGGVARVA